MGEMQVLGFDVVLEEMSGYLEVQVAGRFLQAEVLALIERLAVEIRGRTRPRLLVDMTAVAGHATDMERYEYGLRAVERLGAVERLAVLGAAHHNVNRMFEDVARNRGLPVRVFL